METLLNDSAGSGSSGRDTVVFIERDDAQWILIQHAMKFCFAEAVPIRVATPEEALALFRDWDYTDRNLPRLIVMDLYLPQSREGLTLLQDIKNTPSFLSRIPIVVFSESTLCTDISEAYELGIASYVVKPVGFDNWLTCFSKLRAYWWQTVKQTATEGHKVLT